MREGRVRRELRLREKRYEVEQLIKRKCSEDYDVLEETADLSQGS